MTLLKSNDGATIGGYSTFTDKVKNGESYHILKWRMWLLLRLKVLPRGGSLNDPRLDERGYFKILNVPAHWSWLPDNAGDLANVCSPIMIQTVMFFLRIKTKLPLWMPFHCAACSQPIFFWPNSKIMELFPKKNTYFDIIPLFESMGIMCDS